MSVVHRGSYFSTPFAVTETRCITKEWKRSKKISLNTTVKKGRQRAKVFGKEGIYICTKVLPTEGHEEPAAAQEEVLFIFVLVVFVAVTFSSHRLSLFEWEELEISAKVQHHN
ncbi:hypothetical protein TRVL_09916 [Trypanosoma vivax]|nr:hypothetical protein TRVL_09916 [Trypanosoma vivax]